MLFGNAEQPPILELSTPGNKAEEAWLDERGPGIFRVEVQTKENTPFSAQDGGRVAGDSAASGTREVQLVCRL